MKLLLLTARRVARAAAPAAASALRPCARPVLNAVSVPGARFLSDKPGDKKNADAAKLFASKDDSDSDSDGDSDSDSDSEDEEQEAEEQEVVELLPIDEEGISTAERRRRLDAFLEHNATYFDEERWGAQDGDKWFGFDGDLDAVTEEGVPTWLQSVRNMISVEEERAIRAKSARIAFHDARNKIVRTRKLDEKGRAYGTGRRKTSTARVWVKPAPQPFTGRIKVNKKDLVDYFVRDTHREDVLKPFSVVEQIGGFDVYCTVKGGGMTGQAGAVRHGIARALQNFDPEMRPALKKAGLLTRDPRMVERKKAGQAKARKKFQWVKR
ncbi:30S ribosomal protein S9 [Phytophthora cinnamomi]|uniref:30S ribosomal protein S9 n=1 Tax=Phytophthora cinnamomi TaxID=4785 RepID=UPI00355A602A|nr:30S ribosomal protein S9 [Phytophthora cinnamomi]